MENQNKTKTKKENKELAVQSTTTMETVSVKQLEALKNQIAVGATIEELQLFAKHCNHTKLDPFIGQIHFIKRGGKPTFQTSIDGFRVIAERSSKYQGQTPAEWCGQDGIWREVWIANTPPAAARIGVYRSDFQAPLYAVAKYSSYFVSSSPLWKKMPEVMISKVAEALALRKAFPNDLVGIYTEDEMAQADEPINGIKKVITIDPEDQEKLNTFYKDAVEELNTINDIEVLDCFGEILKDSLRSLIDEIKPEATSRYNDMSTKLAKVFGEKREELKPKTNTKEPEDIEPVDPEVEEVETEKEEPEEIDELSPELIVDGMKKRIRGSKTMTELENSWGEVKANYGEDSESKLLTDSDFRSLTVVYKIRAGELKGGVK